MKPGGAFEIAGRIKSPAALTVAAYMGGAAPCREP